MQTTSLVILSLILADSGSRGTRLFFASGGILHVTLAVAGFTMLDRVIIRDLSNEFSLCTARRRFLRQSQQEVASMQRVVTDKH